MPCLTLPKAQVGVAGPCSALGPLRDSPHPQVLCVGPTGTGKTLTISDKLLKNLPMEYISHFLVFSARTSANQTQDVIDGKLDKRHVLLVPSWAPRIPPVWRNQLLSHLPTKLCSWVCQKPPQWWWREVGDSWAPLMTVLEPPSIRNSY